MRIIYKAIKPILHTKNKVLADIEAHSKQPLFDSDDPMSKSHESLHGINNEMSEAQVGGRGIWCGVYCLNDIAFIIKEPKGLTIQDVANKVPQSFRGGICEVYDLYLIKQQADWNNRPLYLTDEHSAYIGGAEAALEAARLGDMDANRWSDLQNAVYFNMFVSVLYSLLPLGSVQRELYELITFQLARVKNLLIEFDKVRILRRPETNSLLSEYETSSFFKPFNSPGGLGGYGVNEYL